MTALLPYIYMKSPSICTMQCRGFLPTHAALAMYGNVCKKMALAGLEPTTFDAFND